MAGIVNRAGMRAEIGCRYMELCANLVCQKLIFFLITHMKRESLIQKQFITKFNTI